MAKTILVALNRSQNISALLQRLERVVEPGDRIAFLVEYQLDIPSCLLAHVVLLQTGVENGIACEERKARLTWDEQKAWAEKNIAQQARRAFDAIGVEIDVELYCGSLNRMVTRYLNNDEVTLIYRGTPPRLRRINIVRTGVNNWFARRWRHYRWIRLMDSEG